MKTRTLTVVFEHKAETKNKQRFDEVVAEGQAPIVGGLYIRKEEAGAAKRVTAVYTLEEPDEAPAAEQPTAAPAAE